MHGSSLPGRHDLGAPRLLSFASLGAGLRALRELVSSRPFLWSAGALAALVAGLLGGFLAWIAGGADPASPLAAFSLGADGGPPERFEYACSLVAAALLVLCFRRTGRWVYAVLAGLHAWLLLDNALQLHEQLGARLETLLLARGGPALGESLVFLGVMSLAAALAGLALARAQGLHRALGLALFAGAGSLVVFAAGVDVVHGRLAALSSGLDQSLTVLEDGGELVVFAFNAALAFAAWSRLKASAALAARP